MEQEIKPYVGVGKIQFGMNSEQIKSILGDECVRIDNRYVPGYKECFKGINIHYGANGCCEAIEGNSQAGFNYENILIVDQPFSKVLKKFREIDKAIVVDENGFISYELGIGAYVPTLKKSKNELIKSVLVFKKNYYDE